MKKVRNLIARHRTLSLVGAVAAIAVVAAAAWLSAPSPVDAGPVSICPHAVPPSYASGEGTGPSCGTACAAAQADALASIPPDCSTCDVLGDCGCACAIGGSCSASFAMSYRCRVFL